MEIKKINSEKCQEMLREYEMNGKCSEMGLFYFEEEGKFIAVANETGDMFMEEFSDEENCVRYLEGKSCVTAEGISFCEENNPDKFYQEASGWDNGHDIYVVTNIESADEFFSFICENVSNSDQFSDAKVEGNVITFHGTGDRYYFVDDHEVDILEVISKEFPEAVCYYNDCWDEPLWLNCCIGGSMAGKYNLKLVSLTPGGDDDTYDVDIVVTDIKTGYQFNIGGGSISYDEIVDFANTLKPDSIGYNIMAELHKLTCGLTDSKEVFLQYILDEFQLEFGASGLVRNIVEWVWAQSMDKEDSVKALIALLDSTGITENEISLFVNWE